MLRRFLLGLASFVCVTGILGGFIYFTYRIAQPVERVARRPLATGVVAPSEELERQGPLYMYVALRAGSAAARPTVVDDQLMETDERFELLGDPAFETRLDLLVRVETPSGATFCTIRRLPDMRLRDDGRWEIAATGEALPPLRLEVGVDDVCGALGDS